MDAHQEQKHDDNMFNFLPMFPTLSKAKKIIALSFTKDINKLSYCI